MKYYKSVQACALIFNEIKSYLKTTPLTNHIMFFNINFRKQVKP